MSQSPRDLEAAIDALAAGEPAARPEPLPPSELEGSDVVEAARRANGAGWLVRAYPPDSVLTADYRPNRMNLCYSPEGIVLQAAIG